MIEKLLYPWNDKELTEKINEIIDLVNKLPTMIQGHKWQEAHLNAEKEERCPSCGSGKLHKEVFDKITRISCGMCPYETTENNDTGKPSEMGEEEISKILPELKDSHEVNFEEDNYAAGYNHAIHDCISSLVMSPKIFASKVDESDIYIAIEEQGVVDIRIQKSPNSTEESITIRQLAHAIAERIEKNAND